MRLQKQIDPLCLKHPTFIFDIRLYSKLVHKSLCAERLLHQPSHTHNGSFCMIRSKKYEAFLSSKLVQSDWFGSNYWINIYISSLKNTFFNKSCSNFLGGKKGHHIFWIKFCNFGRLTQSAGSVKILSLYSMCTTNMCTALRKTSCCGHVVVSLVTWNHGLAFT